MGEQMKEAVNLIESLNIDDEPVVLACSYGPDSMVLLHLLLSLDFKIVVAHINHKFRDESDQEYELLKSYCQNEGIIFEGTEITNFPKGNLEENAREIRYNFFKEVIKKHQAKYLFTAHHGDDLVETILMRLVRGASFKGYAGFNKLTQQDGYKIVRPLIFYSKEKLLEYAKENRLEFALDQTNMDDNYTRNRLRHHVLPELKKENKKVHQKFLKFSEMIHEYEEYISHETTRLLNGSLYQNERVDLNEFLNLDRVWQTRVLNAILLKIYGDKINQINDRHIELIMRLTLNKQNSYVVLPNNLKIAKFYQMLIFDYHANQTNSYNYLLKNKVVTPGGIITKVNESNITKSNYLLRLNSQEISLPLYVRTRKHGDKIAVKNLKGTQKVGDILINSKLPKDERDSYPLLVDNNDQILWIPGIKKSKNDKLKSENYDIILQYIQKGEENEK